MKNVVFFSPNTESCAAIKSECDIPQTVWPNQIEACACV